MNQIKIHDKTFKPFIAYDKICEVVDEMAAKMNRDLKDQNPLFVCILNGSFMFAAELFKRIDLVETEISFVKMASYEGDSSTGTIKQLIGLNENLTDRTVVVLEDIVDTGLTIENIMEQLRGFGPRKVLIATLLLKPEALKIKVQLDYVGMEIPNNFIVGYGLDYDGYGRNLKDIYTIVNEKEKNMLNLVLFGPPGAGKGTQAEYLKENYHLAHLSTGDLLRSELAQGTALGKEAKKFMDKGELVPDEVVIGMIRSRLENSSDTKGFIFDGFPRTVEQAKALDQLLDDYETPISAMLSLEVEKQELIDRLLSRGKDSGRADDQDESVIENRINVYNEKTAPLKEYYRKQGKYHPIDGMGSIEDIAARLQNEVDKL